MADSSRAGHAWGHLTEASRAPGCASVWYRLLQEPGSGE